MKIKNILIAFGVLGIGLILYKLLLGFVLPIALFVSLRYVLRFLLRGSDADSLEDGAQILSNINKTSSTESIVEIKAIKEDKPKFEKKLSEVENLVEVEKSKENKTSVEGKVEVKNKKGEKTEEIAKNDGEIKIN